ncbi:MAG: hypothetical protein Q8O55_11900 [Dehalococcoidales bacterium]|nr:hypothetical protein [Dehalococcoidales bacterium]MDZ4230993.1 hypothetical protein [Dehalococcoidales bacterium]
MSTMRLYGGSIAIVSGGYSLYLSTTTGMTMDTPAWLMLVLGLVVLIHGVILLTPLAGRLGGGNGIAMVVYSVLMLLNQGWMAAMRPPMGMASGVMTGNMTWNPGMVAIALLMLISGLIMTVRKEMM